MAAQESRLVIVIDAKNAERTASALNSELQNITTSGNQADKQVGVLGTSIRALAGYMAGVVTVGAAINKMDAYTNLQNRLKLVTTNQQELNKATTDTFRIAQNSRQAWDGVVQVYQRFSDNAKTLNIDMAKTAELTETVSKAVAISGASSQAAEAALTQFGQALASGTLRGEELNSILEQTPALAKAIAQGMGITVGQLRAVAAEGKITGDVLVEALTRSKASVDDLFSRTDVTIGQSFTLLNNEVQKFVGEAGKGSGAAELLSGSIKTLAENLGLITNAAIVVGVGYLTKAIVTKTMAVQADIAATIAQLAATQAQLQSEVALAAAATNDAKAHLALTQATNASTQAKFGATAASLRYKLAVDAVTAAVTQQAAAEKAAQAATITSARVGSSLLGVLGGPVGIGLTVASLAAGYLLMRDNTAKANDKLEEQGAIANKTTEELLKLEGAQRSGAKQDLAEAFKEQNAELERLDTLIGNSIAKISSKNTADAETAKILREVRTGVMDYESAFDALNKTQFASPDVIKKLRDEIDKYEEQRLIVQKNADAQKTLGVQVELSGNKAQNAAGKIDQNSRAMNDNKTATEQATKAQQEYNKSLGDRAYDAAYIKTLREKYGFTKELAEETLKAQIAQGRNAKGISKDSLNRIEGVVNLEGAIKSLDEAEKERESNLNKARTKAKNDAEKAKKEAKKLAEEQFDLRESIAYEFADRTMQIEMDLQAKIADIQKANFSPQNTAGYIANARARAESEKEIFVAQLEYELNEFNLSEDAKLKKKYEINKLMIESDLDLSNENRDIALRLTEQKYKLEKAFLELSRQQREFQAREQFLSETDRINERYRLEEGEILKINDAKERAFMLEMNRLKKQTEEQDRLNKARLVVAANQTNANGTGQFEAIEVGRNEAVAASEELYQAELARNFEARESLYAAHNERVNQINRSADQAQLQLQLNYGEKITGSLADMFGSMRGEQSKAYRVMFAASKAFAIAQSGISILQGIAQAAANPWPLNLVAMATVAASTASLIGNIRSINDAGFKTGGYTGNGGTSDVAGVVHGQEYVLNAAATRRVGVGTLDALNSGSNLGQTQPVNVIINVPQGYDAIQRQDENGVTIDIVEKMISQSWQNVQQPNSSESRSVQRAFALKPSR